MEDRSNEIISQYDMKIYRSYRARGGMVLESSQGLKFLSPCHASERRLEFENALKHQMQEHGYLNLDNYVKNKDNKLSSSNGLGERYCIRDWFDMEECSMKREESIFMAAENLALLHLAMTDIQMPEDSAAVCMAENLEDIFERRNRELKRVRAYLTKRKNKSAFEIRYLNCSGSFYEEAQKAASSLTDLGIKSFFEESKKAGKVIHGCYTYHNILIGQKAEKSPQTAGKAEDTEIATVNFDKAVFGIQVYDLYQYMRKVMEKNGWQYSLGSRLIAAYERVRALSLREKKLLCILLSYPEKFWKITNYYYNSRKSLIPQKNIDKLEMLLEQQNSKQEFLLKFSRF